ncbi:sulfate transporter CysZ [Biostraticola tofi]|uniref:Sulfate transporter CysZ n=1 Tax=Biostraticola tofi TaxID=466109 RepID=A0A4R3Z8Q9_9GAMM|nr:sulfate transporter CysZ [Biostraticola tofi]TCW00480.1 CysZ protein [Biostraticola tofi]
MQNDARKRSGLHYFISGWRLVTLPGIKRYVMIPLLLNIILLGGSFWWLYSKLNEWMPKAMAYIPDWLQWLSYILWPLSVVAILLIFGYFFSTIANLIASPFSGLLAEKLEARLTGKPLPDSGWIGLLRDTPRILHREWLKLVYYLPRAVMLLLLYFIPGFGQTVAPILWFAFSAWMLAVQYCDFPFDNHKVPFRTMRGALRRHKYINLQFGALVSIFTLIPVVNLMIMPVAVCGATAMWVDRYRDEFVADSPRP